MNTICNRNIVERLHQNDVEAFDEIYWKYSGIIYSNILKLVKDEEHAKDLTQDVFLTLWEKKSALKPDMPVAGWLFVVSYNKSLSFTKRALKNELAGERYSLKEYDTIANFDVTDQQLNLLEGAIQGLSPQKRKVFELCKLQGMTYQNVANELQISKYTVKEYLSSAIAAIKNYVTINSKKVPVIVLFLFLSDLFF